MKRIFYISSNIFLFLGIFLFFTSCDFFTQEIKTAQLDSLINPMSNINPPEKKNRQWSILVYMAADNDLESAALEDLYEMEVSNLNTDEISVFVLLDRSNSYDTSNDNWTDSRMYRLKTGRNKECKTIISDEINCEDLGIVKDSKTELDMSSKYTLTKALNYIKVQFPSEQIGLIMWGHGTGWRNSSNNHTYKGFAYDDSTGSYMTLKQFGDGIDAALNGMKLDFIGLDTCFGGELEVMYELRNKTNYAIGTEGLLLLSGWNYEHIFNKFNNAYSKTAKTFVNICIQEFKNDYGLKTNASIVGVDTTYIEQYFNCFDLIMKLFAENINSKEIRDMIFNSLFCNSNNITKSFSYGRPNSDVYLDILSLVKTCSSKLQLNDAMVEKLNELELIRKSCIWNSWSSENMECGLGVYFGTLTEGNLIASIHDKSYIKEKTFEQIHFVKDSYGYVPGQINKDSFLDKLFYVEY